MKPADLSEWQRAFINRWALGRPAHVKEIACAYPPTSRVISKGRMFWVIGYTEASEVICLAEDPCAEHAKQYGEFYEGAEVYYFAVSELIEVIEVVTQ